MPFTLIYCGCVSQFMLCLKHQSKDLVPGCLSGHFVWYCNALCPHREDRDQDSYGQRKHERRWTYSLNDDVFSEEKAPSTRSAAKDYLLEEDTSYSTKDSKSAYATEPRKESPPESSATREAPALPKSLAEEESSALLSTRYSVNAQTGSAQVSASLPRSYQKTDTSRLTSVVTPRPFGVHSRGISSLPRSFTVKFRFIPKVCKCWGLGQLGEQQSFNICCLLKKIVHCLMKAVLIEQAIMSWLQMFTRVSVLKGTPSNKTDKYIWQNNLFITCSKSPSCSLSTNLPSSDVIV